ncbi:GtrA family protein [Oricola thermophila]|uniref:GtrA family protein n=1 Tax=Oricola thermophila TaxID=2742145 RepID=A0A6N1VKS9_9HYPH|nr:GtrA family protein [Oricola thermophila]QKV19809.1 GtrA family protein [Oricola thermophila]
MSRSWKSSRIARFGIVGIAATMLYMVLALAFEASFPRWPAAAGAVGAYAIAGLFSYFAHKLFTFGSECDHAQEAPRFIVVTLGGYALAALLPLVLHDIMKLPLLLPVLLTATLVPIVNFIALRWFVFRTSVVCEVRSP